MTSDSQAGAAGTARGLANGPFRIGLLGHGTVGRAFAELLDERADAIEAEVGRRPEISGVLTRSRGDFDDILERSDLVVECCGLSTRAATW